MKWLISKWLKALWRSGPVGKYFQASRFKAKIIVVLYGSSVKRFGKPISFTFTECSGDRPKINQVRFQWHCYKWKNMNKPFYVYVDVDETFVRNYGTKRIPMPNVIEHIKALSSQGAVMYCWRSGGAEYAQNSAREFGIEICFTGFLPKPEVAIDDMVFSEWRNLLQVHPNECLGNTIESYKAKIISKPSTI